MAWNLAEDFCLKKDPNRVAEDLLSLYYEMLVEQLPSTARADYSRAILKPGCARVL